MPLDELRLYHPFFVIPLKTFISLTCLISSGLPTNGLKSFSKIFFAFQSSYLEKSLRGSGLTDGRSPTLSCACLNLSLNAASEEASPAPG